MDGFSVGNEVFVPHRTFAVYHEVEKCYIPVRLFQIALLDIHDSDHEAVFLSVRRNSQICVGDIGICIDAMLYSFIDRLLQKTDERVRHIDLLEYFHL